MFASSWPGSPASGWRSASSAAVVAPAATIQTAARAPLPSTGLRSPLQPQRLQAAMAAFSARQSIWAISASVAGGGGAVSPHAVSILLPGAGAGDGIGWYGAGAGPGALATAAGSCSGGATAASASGAASPPRAFHSGVIPISARKAASRSEMPLIE